MSKLCRVSFVQIAKRQPAKNKAIKAQTSKTKIVKKRYLLSLCAVFALWLYPAPAQAGYRPPRTARLPQGPAIPGGRRGGCAMPAGLGLTALSPQSHVGRTQSLQPTLAWFVPSEVPYEATFQLYRYDDGHWTLVDQRSLGQSRYGYMDYKLPATPELSAGNLYRWNIVLACDPSRPSASQAATAQFEIVPAQVSLDRSAISPLQLADKYSDAGLWYDAIAALSTHNFTAETTTYLSQLLLETALIDETNASPAALLTPSPLRRIARLLTEESSTPTVLQ